MGKLKKHLVLFLVLIPSSLLGFDIGCDLYDQFLCFDGCDAQYSECVNVSNNSLQFCQSQLQECNTLCYCEEP